MRLTVVGCSGSFAGPESPASSYLVQTEHEGRTWSVLLDLGSGALGPLQRHLDLADLDAVLLSHLHPDHCADVLGLYVTRRYRPAGPLPRRMPLYGPSGTAERLALMYHGLEPGGMESEFDVRVVRDAEPVRVGPFTVTPYAVAHPVEAYGYRVEADGEVLAFTGDTDTCDNLSPLLAGADLALLDCAFVDGRDATRGVHLTGSRAAAAAVAAGGVRRLVLTHIPAWNDPRTCRGQAAGGWPGTVELATAGWVTAVGAAPADPGSPDVAAAHRMWDAYRAATPGLPPEDDVEIGGFGDSPEMADRLLAYVLGGTKRATASLVAEYAAENEALPRVGDHWVVCDGAGSPRVVLRATELRVGPLASVDERFAWDEGEGDRTLQSWLDEHRGFFRRSCARIGTEFSDDLEVCFERFRVVWPPEHADG
ncbi:MBL fold metallo-hydrolase [Phycicoccus duodecadis]|uniref:Ribonuclease BN (tRNA processing enzyme) n=1 Tax=Phycicoccus duodecadis TaxID=173053 RepID=A0A2N3YJP8_9MICO|nr:ribonuclease BN (tRNA processing enzyme) [Phycicoccus duodecadis]